MATSESVNDPERHVVVHVSYSFFIHVSVVDVPGLDFTLQHVVYDHTLR